MNVFLDTEFILVAVILLLTSLCYLRRQTRSAWILNSSFHVRTATSISICCFERLYLGRVNLEDEADEFYVSMPEFDRLNGRIVWIDVSFVERQRTPEWAIQVGIRCNFTIISI